MNGARKCPISSPVMKPKRAYSSIFLSFFLVKMATKTAAIATIKATITVKKMSILFTLTRVLPPHRTFSNGQNDHYYCCVIPGLTRNPEPYNKISHLDAGSSPA